MESLLRPIARRFGQPIVLSFCIAWVVWNWEIVLALIWYDQDSIIKLGSYNYVNHIEKYRDLNRNLWMPLLLAFLYPVLNLGFNAFYSLVLRADKKLSLNILKTTIVPMSKYLTAQKVLEEREKSISAYITQKDELESELRRLRSKVVVLESDKVATENQLKISTKNLQNSSGRLKVVEELLFVYEEKSSPDYFNGTFTINFIIQNADRKYRRKYEGGKIEFNVEPNSNEHLVSINSEDATITFYISQYFYNIKTNAYYIKVEPLTDVVLNELTDEDKEIQLIRETFLRQDLFIMPHSIKSDSFIIDSVKSGVRIELVNENPTNTSQTHPDPS